MQVVQTPPLGNVCLPADQQMGEFSFGVLSEVVESWVQGSGDSEGTDQGLCRTRWRVLLRRRIRKQECYQAGGGSSGFRRGEGQS